MSPSSPQEQLGINVIRGLAMDMPRRANSGHPGTAMALAPLAHVLWAKVMTYDASDPAWPNRDRFILSAGHASPLIYSMLYLTGYGLSVDDLKAFRQLGSRTPGHPESAELPGIEVTTGPLGQGVANSVGMAVAERLLRAQYGPELVNHYTFVICSDGDLMEGVSHEAASLAGHLGLGKLIWVYDDNHITIDGPTEIALSDDAVKRFQAYRWHTEDLGEVANDTAALEAALRRAMAEEDRPSFLQLRSHIGWPAPHMTDNPKAHGEPFDPEEIRVTKEILGLPPDEEFYLPPEVVQMYREAGARSAGTRKAWYERLEAQLPVGSPERERWDTQWAGKALPGYEKLLPVWEPGEKLATRAALKSCLNAVISEVPGLVAGGADLTGNTGTALDGVARQGKEHPEGRQLAFGVREHAMGGAMVGMARHGGLLPVGGTFFVFSDYMRPSVRLAALSKSKVIYSWTHDSVGLGEDGPTHQPVEQLAAMRAMPGLTVVRPADANETAHALRLAVESDGPTALILTRQAVPVLDGTAEAAEWFQRGAYVLKPEGRPAGEPGRPAREPGGHTATRSRGAGGPAGDEKSAGGPAGEQSAGGPAGEQSAGWDGPDIVLVGTGSEVSVCVAAASLLEAEGLRVRVVSFPSWELFSAQDEEYQQEVLGAGAPVLAVEAAASLGWERWADATVTLDRFGASGPGGQVLAHFGFTAENVAEKAKALLSKARSSI
jgi:transketolase